MWFLLDIDMSVLAKNEITDRLEILADATIQVRYKTQITEDGKEISFTYSREVLAPGDDVTGKPDPIPAIAELLWTPEVVQRYKESLPQQPQF